MPRTIEYVDREIDFMKKTVSYLILLIVLVSPLSYAENTLQKFSALENAGLLLLDKQGQAVLSKKINRPFIPASTTKLVTAWLALKNWGEDYHFKTKFYLDRSTQTLWVKGSGDPFLVSEEIQLIAKNLKELGIKQIKTIALDSSLFQADLLLPGTGKTNNPYDAVPSAIAANFNTVYVKKINGLVVSAEQETPLTDYAKQLASHLKKGSLRMNTGRNPAKAEVYFAQLLAEFLRQQGVKVGTDIVHGQLGKQVLFYTHKNSKSLAQMIRAMMKYSTNFLANQLVLVLSAEAYHRPANAKDVQKYMESTLSKQFKWKNFSMKDGAGLSRENRLSPEQLVDLLQAFKEWKHLLPEIETGIFAKSGTMNKISTLAGYIVEEDQWQPFAIMMNQAVPYKFRNRIALALANKH